MKMMTRFSLHFQINHVRDAPISTSVEEWNARTPASPATARANKVLPVPGGPNRTPFGIRNQLQRT